jgi:protein-L-isoaspartate O-methyltransferase
VRFHLEQPMPAPVEEVIDVLVDPGFLASLAELPKLGRPEVLDQRVDGHLVHQRVRYHFAGALSPAVTAVVDPAKLVWVDETTYDRSTASATFRIVPEHYADRLRAGGTYRFTATGPAACTRVADGELVVRFPLVGGKVERAIVSGLKEHLGQEAALVRRWLERGAPAG